MGKDIKLFNQVRCFFGLPMVPITEVRRVFELLGQQIDDELKPLWNYVRVSFRMSIFVAKVSHNGVKTFKELNLFPFIIHSTY